MCCRCVKYLNLSNLLMVSGVTPHSLLDQELLQRPFHNGSPKKSKKKHR
jgi:hypothetical protein